MTKFLKKTLSILSAAAILCGATGTPLPCLLDSVSITVEATTVATGSYGSRFCEWCGTDTWLYFTVTDSLGLTAAVTGSSITSANAYVTIPATVNWMGKTYKVTSIGAEAFKNQTNLCNLGGGENLTDIAPRAFQSCTNLGSVGFLTSGYDYVELENIGEYAFINCKKMTNFVNWGNVKNIGKKAFYGCNKLSNITLQGTAEIGEGAFGQCYSAQYIDLSQTELEMIPKEAFYNCNAATEIKMPNTVTRIESSAFYRCESFEKIYLPNVNYIGDSAFRYCYKLETVMTDEALATIGDAAFQICDSMQYFVCKNPNVKIGNYALGYSYRDKIVDFVIWGNDGTAKTYASAKGFTYHHVKDAAELAKVNYEQYMWQTGNHGDAWAADGKYYYADEHKPYIKSEYPNYDCLNATFAGCCAGMATVSALTRNGDLTVEQFTKNQFTEISKITTSNMSKFTKSFVNSCWASFFGDKNDAFDYCIDYANHGIMSDKEMLTYIEYITYGADAAVLSYRSNGGGTGHAVVCFGMEFRENASAEDLRQWNSWGFDPNAKILIYDGNDKTFLNSHCYYVNTETGQWQQVNGYHYAFYGNAGHYTAPPKWNSNMENGMWQLTHTTKKMFLNAKYHTGMDAINDLLK